MTEDFEEQFPSLKSTGAIYEQTAFTQSTIKKHCLDKQKVKEAIEEILKEIQVCNCCDNPTEVEKGIEKFKEELGLE